MLLQLLELLREHLVFLLEAPDGISHLLQLRFGCHGRGSEGGSLA